MLRNSLLASTALLLSSKNSDFSWPDAKTKDLLRLNWNENPYGPSKKVLQAITDSLQSTHRYPDDAIATLKDQLARRNGLSSEQVLLTSGSTEVLSLLGLHAGLQKGEILTPWPSFPTLIEFGKSSGANIQKVELGDNERIDLNRVKDSISARTTVIFICNPNNPTSTEVPTADLKAFCRAVPENVLLCVDEAYIEYSAAGIEGSMAALVEELPNLIICRTFSKAYGLAGLRIGYALSQKQNIEALRKMHPGWEISTGIAAVTGAIHALEDPSHLRYCVEENAKGRQILYRAFNQWGITYAQSGTNFVYAQSAGFDPNIVQKLQEEGVLITKWPDMTRHIRISIARPEDMEIFVEKAGRFKV
jgi:histidinol-phosphate aminotransferase